MVVDLTLSVCLSSYLACSISTSSESVDYSLLNQLVSCFRAPYSASPLKEVRSSSLCFVILEQIFHYVKSNYNSEKNKSMCEVVK